MSAQLMTAGSDDRYLAYYGNYDVNVYQGIVRHYVERGSRPDLTDRTFTLQYELDNENDTLILSEVGGGQVTSRATWQRHR